MFTIYCDGGGNADTRLYFSFKVYKGKKVLRHVDRFFVDNLIDLSEYPPRTVHIEGKPHQQIPDSELLLPRNCSIVDTYGNGTNNIAEYVALYMALSTTQEYRPVQVWSDSQLIVKHYHGDWKCRQAHLRPWLQACLNYRYQIEVAWVSRKTIVEHLGH